MFHNKAGWTTSHMKLDFVVSPKRKITDIRARHADTLSFGGLLEACLKLSI